MLKIGIHRVKYHHSQWYYYIIPRRLTLKCNPPIYKWLWFVISYEKGFYWDGLYEHFDRLSCWCCPLKNLKELKILYKYYPDLWNELKKMDEKAYNQFRADYSVEQLEQKFKADLVVKE